MDYRKVDAALAMTLDQESAGGANLDVLIRTRQPLEPDEQARLVELGVEKAAGGVALVTASLTPSAVRALSEQACIESVSLSRKRSLK